MLSEGTEKIYVIYTLRRIATISWMKKSSIKSELTEEAVHKQDKEDILRMATVVRSEPPAFISPKTNKQVPFEDYRLELEAWTLSTDVEKEKQAVIAARSLPAFLDGVKLRNKVMKDVTLVELDKDTGMNKLLEWLDNRFKKDENTEGFKYFKEWMSLERDPSKHKTIEEFIDHYDNVVSEAESKGVNNFEVIKAYRLLEACNLFNVEKQLVFSGIDFKKTEELYVQARNALKKFKVENAEMIGGTKDKVCIDAAFLSRHEDVLASHGYKKQWKPKRAFNSSYGRGGSKNGDREEGRRGYKEKSLPKKKNPLGSKGKRWTCHYCESEYHFIRNCDKRKKEAKIVEDGSEGEAEDGFSWIAVLEEVEKNPEKPDIANVSLALICEQTEGKGLLDCAGTSPVAGEDWIKEFIKGSSEEDKKNIVEEKSTKTFKFGGGEVRSSIKCVTLPVEVAGVKGMITTDVVKVDLPLLLGMPVLK